MLAVHFGAGNIGRGFIGLLLNQANYHTTFVDVNAATVEEINKKQQYNVVLAAEESETVTVKNVSAINSIADPDKVIEAIREADLITTAVGPNILAIISELIAKGLSERAKTNKKPLNLIACENMVGGSDLLKEKVYSHITEAEHAAFDELYGFPNAAVDRIVPNQVNEDPLEVSVEPYFEWVVEEPAFKGEVPTIDGVTYVQDLKPYIERKLFTVNTGHAVPAYIGRQMGYKTINEAMHDEKVQEIIKGALAESGEAVIQTYDFDRAEHQEYINKIIGRFMNPYISDEVTRVARGPIRKLGAHDRLIRPASVYMEVTGGKEPTYLAKTIAAALNYKFDEDKEAVELQQMIAEHGIVKTLEKVSGLDADHPLVGVILREV
ncbi:mannitol-1-phosphate 5-dehydrogenase [Oceanobacillus chungangensis]|uniref:Mannitol-1-phosphate 5-dehydrogenase n=1 Tax=Oceanobacillus chungangensis TaxID=1229152 RepID=A0A3D8PXV2_9BACI|nr:mannitol-1-phosphate 5-dehydrogenase [Oceanobacillus chungangensis]RDW20612.1 mannitol-1-phosphate 5-dehydrogenase [Oceanobacillus chungangensis]